MGKNQWGVIIIIKNSFPKVALVILSVIILSISFPTMSNAEGVINVNKEAEINEDVITKADPNNLELKSMSNEIDAFTFTNNIIDVSIPKHSNEFVEISDQNDEKVSMGIVANTKKQAHIDGDTVFYSDLTKDITSGIQVFDGGVRQLIIIESINSPQKYNIDFKLPKNGYFQFSVDPYTGQQDGSIEIHDGANNIVAALDTPWAKDANGKILKTHYEINGNTIIQIVEHNSDGVVYPVTADPKLYSAFFSKGSWIVRSGVRSLSLVPTILTRGSVGMGIVPSLAIRAASWSTVKGKFSSSSYWSNTAGLKDQYDCHYNFAFYKSSFNLEPSRPNVGLIKTISKKCNP